MKSRKVYLYGILMLIILIAFVGCAADKNLEEIIKTPEDLVIAYIEEFSQENFKKIETMFEESANFGKEYYSQSQLAPKDDLEIIKSQNLFITHFYGEDAWNNVEYELEEITLKNNNSANTTSNLENEVDSDMDAYIETKSIKKYRANFVFNDLPLHYSRWNNSAIRGV